MIICILGDDIVAEVKMTRSAFAGAILLVEGDCDYKLFSNFIDKQKCTIIPSHGKDNAIKAIELLESSENRGVLAIVDADFSNILDIKYNSVNLLITDYHDIEITILKSGAFNKFFREFGSSRKIDSYLRAFENYDLLEVLLERSLPIGIFRFISETDNLNLKFEGIKYEKFINKNTLKVNRSILIRNVLALTKSREINERLISDRLEKCINSWTHVPEQTCCGHDVIAIISVGLRKALGSKSASDSKCEKIEKAFRLSYDSSEFKKTNLFAATKSWEKRNPSYRVFKV